MNADAFRKLALYNTNNDAILDALLRLDLPDAWIVAGSLVQTIWNIRTGRAIDHGISDYDVFYFDPDPSWEAEDRVIALLRETSIRLGVRIEARNQARVHLWYERKHGTPYPALTCSTEGIGRFLTRCTQVGMRRTPAGNDVYAPHGLNEIATLVVRPNITPNFSVSAYAIKTARWKSMWPELTIE